METDFFTYQHNSLHCERVSVSQIAEKIPTPFYLYSHSALKAAYQSYAEAFSAFRPLISFAVKANSNGAVIKTLAQLGAGADVVSYGEMARALKAGVPAGKIVFSGVGKTAFEIEKALEAGIYQFNVESRSELHAIAEIAKRLKTRAPIALRVNPNVDPKTHPYISTGLKKNKFGIPAEEALSVYREAAALPALDVVAISCHIGSQLTDVSPFVESLSRLEALISDLKRDGIVLKRLDLGGGLGIRYRDENPPTPEAYAKAAGPLLKKIGLDLILEPGRSLCGSAGILVTKILYIKPGEEKTFVVVDGAMNDLMRPALYNAYQEIQPVETPTRANSITADVVGPVCETGDFFARDRTLPAPREGELLAIMSAGAYGAAMSSTYNSRPFIAEVMVSGDQFAIVRKPGTVEDLMVREQTPIFLK